GMRVCSRRKRSRGRAPACFSWMADVSTAGSVLSVSKERGGVCCGCQSERGSLSFGRRADFRFLAGVKGGQAVLQRSAADGQQIRSDRERGENVFRLLLIALQVDDGDRVAFVAIQGHLVILLAGKLGEL